jgi:hypothetical protein
MVVPNTRKIEIEKFHFGSYFRELRCLQAMIEFLPDSTDFRSQIPVRRPSQES